MTTTLRLPPPDYMNRGPARPRVCANGACRKNFNAHGSGGRKYCFDCSPVVRARQAERSRDPRRLQDRLLKKAYGISLDDYEALLTAQDGVCAICGSDEFDRLGRRLAVLHRHRDQLRVILQVADRAVAVAAEQTAHLAGHVVVVDLIAAGRKLGVAA